MEVSNQCGVQRARCWVEMVQPEKTLIPNVITPNGDGHNDAFQLHQTLLGSSFVVYNRWGKTLYQDADYQNDWQGDGMPAGVYLYTLQHPCLDKPLQGQISILRAIHE